MEYIVLATAPGKGMRIIISTHDDSEAYRVAQVCRTLLEGSEGMVMITLVEEKWETK